MLPIDLIFVRHGQSEENLANKMIRDGDNRLFIPEFRNRHSREVRLTDNGIAQSKSAGEWLIKNAPTPLNGFCVSDFIRSEETAFYLGLPQAQWEVKYELRERDQTSNAIDLFLSYPTCGGESIAALCSRLKSGFLVDLEEECRGEVVIAVCHGHVMRAVQLLLEDLGHDDFIRLDSSKEPADRILNCQIHWYTRRDPKTLELSQDFIAVRSVCAHGLKGDYGWRRIQRRRYSNEELLAEVQRYPRYLNNE